MLVSFNVDNGSREITKHERFYAMKHFSYFVGEGWYRVVSEVSTEGVLVSGYRSPDGKSLVAVAVNGTGTAQSVVLQPEGAGFSKAEGVEVYRSTEGATGERWVSLGRVKAGEVVEMPPRSVVTVRFGR